MPDDLKSDSIKLGKKLSKTLLRLWFHLSRTRKWQFWALVVFMLVSAMAEVVSLGAVLPFVSVLVAPEQALKYSIVMELMQAWDIRPDGLAFILTVLFVAAAIFAGIIRILLLWVISKYLSGCSVDISQDVYQRSLYQPYRAHITRNTSEIISGNIKVDYVAEILLHLLVLISSMILLAAMMTAMVFINPVVAFVAGGVLGSCYGMIALLSRKQVAKNSRCVAIESSNAVKAQQEGLGGIRDIILDGTQPIFIEAFAKANRPFRTALASISFIGQYPRYAMEAIGIVLISGLTFILSGQEGGLTNSLPVLAALALGAQRMLPALQLSYNAWINISGKRNSLEDVIHLLDQVQPLEAKVQNSTPIPFHHTIKFEGVRFRYDDASPYVLDGVDFTIPKGARVGIVGVTGSGKSTALDVLMGLIFPTEGTVLVDGHPINEGNVGAWKANIAHVPQHIYMTDTSVAENIAFGVPHERIDFDKVRQAAHEAQISEFIDNMPDGYDSFVGERGMRISGGQLQRIGIARALYKKAKVLVLDEATSALDVATEQKVMHAIESLEQDSTIIIITHRIETLRNCDMIVEFVNGKPASQGTYLELSKRSPEFIQRIMQKQDQVPVES